LNAKGVPTEREGRAFRQMRLAAIGRNAVGVEKSWWLCTLMHYPVWGNEMRVSESGGDTPGLVVT
jgi:hypothetical protein